jgi:hypothetical protein
MKFATRALKTGLLSTFAMLSGATMSITATIAADRIDSAYTKIDLERCAYSPPASTEGTDGGSWSCKGYKGTPVHVAEGDIRMFVSFGANAESEPAAHQTLPNFNTVNQTLEWRLVDRGGKQGAGQGDWQPFATILRWFPESTDNAGNPVKGQVLVVTRLGYARGGGGTCHIAYINALTTKNANVIARQLADTRASDFNCSKDDIIRVGMAR